MKKNKLSLITLITCTALLVACGGNNPINTSQSNSGSNSIESSSPASVNPSSSNNGEDSIDSIVSSSDSNNYGGDNSSTPAPISSSSNNEPSSAPSSSSSDNPSTSISSSDISSSIDNSSSSQPVVIIDNSLDGQIAQFLKDLDISIPALNEYGLSSAVIYYYAYEQYFIAATGIDADGGIERAYANKIQTETDFVSGNDDDWYTVEDYGYLYSDEEESITINFYSEDGYFYFSLFRNDGEYGELDVSDVDTSWYVDYVNFQGFDVVSNISANDIKEILELDPSTVIPELPDAVYPIYYESEYYDEDEKYYPATFYVLFEGDQISNLVNALKLAGFEAAIEENTGTTLDWDTFEIVEYTYYTGYAYDAGQNIYISIYQDSYDNTVVALNKFSDVFNGNKTTNTDWTDEEKALMNETLHQVLPFMQFGGDYELIDDSDESWDVLFLADTYYEDLSEDYIDLLIKAGFEEYDDPDYGLLYRYDNGFVYIEIFVYYDGGNCLEIYFEESKIPAVTALALNETALDIVAGASFQLEASLTPKDGNPSLVWASNNEDVATVSDKGLVTINENAAIDSSVVITATALSGVSASCTFTVKADIVTALEFTQDSYTIVPNGEKIVTEYRVLPIGATFTGSVEYGIEQDGTDFTGIDYDGFGNLYADETAIPGTTITIFLACGSLKCYATVTVASAEITHTLTSSFFGIKDGESQYNTYKKTTDDGASYEAQAAATHGLQIRSKNSTSGVIGHFDGRTCKSITFTFDSNTYSERQIDIYASNTAFSIADMYGNKLTKIATITYDQSDETSMVQTYTFTSDYSYIGFRSDDGAIYLTFVDIVW